MQKTLRYSLDGSWKLTFSLPEEEKKVTLQSPVPGNVEPLLVEAGLLKDCMPADNVRATERFQFVDDWTYETVFDAPDDLREDTELVFEGIDTLAEIYLNGHLLGNCANMFRSYRFTVGDRLQAKNNQLKVVIRSADLWAREHCHDGFTAGHRAATFYDSQVHLRKARHQWGWDNAPRILTSGIIRPVYLETLPVCRFEDVYLHTTSIDEEFVRIGAMWTYRTKKKCLEDHTFRFTLLDGQTTVYTDTKPVFFIQGASYMCVPREVVSLWWPADFGAPKLYTARLEMLVGDTVCAVYESPFGIRTLHLERSDWVEESGDGEFVFVVNGEKVFARGTNWKPLSPFASEAHRKTAQLQALEEAKKLHCNMIRIWGGGIYEDHPFFDYCDKNGIMVWQDFMFSCEITSLEEGYCREVALEAEEIVKKLRNHPSLAVWCGDNEDDMFFEIGKRGSELRPSEQRITREILKQAVHRFAPYSNYVESSPYIPDCAVGSTRYFPTEAHLYTGVMRYGERIRNLKSIFLGETGPILVNAIAVNPVSYEREKARAERLWDAPYQRHSGIHQEDNYFLTWRKSGRELCEVLYGRDFSFDQWKDYTVAINLACAELFKDAIEYCRVKRWSKSGVLWWSLTDMWPMLFNYSVTDDQQNPKLPYFWIRQSQEPVAMMAVRVEHGGELAVYAVNDTREAAVIEYSVSAYDQGGNSRILGSGVCCQQGNSAAMTQRIAESEEPELWIIRYRIGDYESVNHVFTGRAPYAVMKRWTEILASKEGYDERFLELQ